MRLNEDEQLELTALLLLVLSRQLMEAAAGLP